MRKLFCTYLLIPMFFINSIVCQASDTEEESLVDKTEHLAVNGIRHRITATKPEITPPFELPQTKKPIKRMIKAKEKDSEFERVYFRIFSSIVSILPAVLSQGAQEQVITDRSYSPLKSQVDQVDIVLDKFMEHCKKTHGVQYARETVKKDLGSTAKQKNIDEFIGLVTCVYSITPDMASALYHAFTSEEIKPVSLNSSQ